MPKVLIIEDDPTVRAGVIRALADRGHEVSAVSSAADGLHQAVSWRPDVVLLDLGLPDLDGREVLRMLRATSQVPIIVVTARSAETEIVRALDAGADDYVVKPFGGAQVDARIRAVLRRSAAEAVDGCADLTQVPAPSRAPGAVQAPAPDTTTGDVVVVGGLRIDPRSRRVWLDGGLLDLTPREFDLLHYLAARAGEVVSKRSLMTHVWRVPYATTDKTIDVHLSWLRRKLGETAQRPRYLHTVHRVGVRLEPPGPWRQAGATEPSAAPRAEPSAEPRTEPPDRRPDLPGRA